MCSVFVSAPAAPSLADWLALHGMTAGACAALLADAAPALPVPAATNAPAEWPDGPALWALIADGLGQSLPELAPEIARTARETVLNFDPDRSRHPRPFALYIAEKRMIYVSCPLKGSARDLLVLAHEFGHAVQLHAIGGAPLPPILREICAFLAEEMLLASLTDRAPEMAGLYALELARHRSRNLGVQRDRLQSCLAQPAAPYDYEWNYPPARSLALRLLQEGARSTLRAVFMGQKSVADIQQITHV